MNDIEVARWLYEKIIDEGTVEQETVVQEIAEAFGAKFTYENENGNLAISRGVLKELGKLKDGKIEWDRRDKYWYVVEASTELDVLTQQSQDDLDKLLAEQAKDVHDLLHGINGDISSHK